MTPEQMTKITGMATGLAKLKAKAELGEGAELTPEEVAGIVWGVRNLAAPEMKARRDASP